MLNIYKKISLCFALLFYYAFAHGQINIIGTVQDADDGKPIHGASITIKGEKRIGVSTSQHKSKIGVSTNTSGIFLLRGVDDNDWVIISNIGYKTQQVSIKKLLKKPIVHMQVRMNELATAEINYKRPAGIQVELKNRKHLNLMQVLEGSVPGLTVRKSSETKSEIVMHNTMSTSQTIRENWDEVMAHDPTQLAEFPDFESYRARVIKDIPMQQLYNGMATSKKNTTTDHGMIAELRGGGGFTGNTNGMLVVIDGFPQDKFPINFPMTNVLSVEIIRDPDEGIKWGSKGINGVILITTNGGKAGRIAINYSSNFYYASKQDISETSLRLMGTKNFLAYYKEAFDRELISYGSNTQQIANLTPAQDLIRSLSVGLDPNIFQQKWDSLGNLSNRTQLELLRQNTFSQNHFLTISGGNQQHQISVTGSYDQGQSGDFGSNTKNMGAVVRGKSSFWKNKLQLQLYLDYNRSKSDNKTQNLGDDLEPYQMLLNPNGNYVYDYSQIIDAETNQSFTDKGYYNSGVNILEDARLNSQTTKGETLNSRLNLDYDIIKGLTWSSSFQYVKSKNWENHYQDPNSSSVRYKANQYSNMVIAESTGRQEINFSLPYGGILTNNSSSTRSVQGRSGLLFLRKFGQDHLVNGNFTASINSNKTFGEFQNITYGYIPGQIAPAFFDIDRDLTFTTIYNQSLSASSLFLDNENSDYDVRNMAATAHVSYTWKGSAKISGTYNSIYSPNYGLDPNYLNTKIYSSELELKLSDRSFFKRMPWVSTLILSGTAGRIELADLPPQVTASRSYQPEQENYGLYIGGFSLPENNGKKINELEGQLLLGVNQERFKFKLKYYVPSIGKTRWSGLISYDLSNESFFKIPFINTWIVDISQQNMSPYQGLKSMIAANQNGSFMTNVDYSILPPELINKEAHMYVGFLNDRIGLDLRYYNRLYSGMSNGSSIPTDPSTGLNSQVIKSSRHSKGFEFALNLGLLQGERSLNWRINFNGAYNQTEVLEVPVIRYSQTAAFLSAPRSGYAADAVWSYNWAGLDESGNPNIYNNEQVKTNIPDSLSVIYSGRSFSPWTGAIMNEWTYRGFFAGARMIFEAGGIMRTYTPVPSFLINRHIDVERRWQKPGDELTTDVPVMAAEDPSRSLITQYSSNSIVSSSFIRLREIQFGYNFPESILKKSMIKNLSISTQVQNLVVWTFNKDHIDPERNSFGERLLPRQPVQFVLSIVADF